MADVSPATPESITDAEAIKLVRDWLDSKEGQIDVKALRRVTHIAHRASRLPSAEAAGSRLPDKPCQECKSTFDCLQRGECIRRSSPPSSTRAEEEQNMENHSLMLELCHQLGAKDGEDMTTMLFDAVRDALRYRWLRDDSSFKTLGAAQVVGEALDHACDKGRQLSTGTPKGTAADPSTLRSAIQAKDHVPPAVRAALLVVVNHIEPGWDNCKAVLQQWLQATDSRGDRG